MFSKNFNRIFTSHRWIHFCCCIIVVSYALVAEAHQTYPGFIERGRVLSSNVSSVRLDGGLQFGYGLQEKIGDACWPICPLKKENAEFGKNSLTEPALGFMQFSSFPGLLVSSPGEIMVDHNLESDAGCRTNGDRQGLKSEWPNHIANFLLGLFVAFILSALITPPDRQRD